jgi:hypothetical protein
MICRIAVLNRLYDTALLRYATPDICVRQKIGATLIPHAFESVKWLETRDSNSHSMKCCYRFDLNCFHRVAEAGTAAVFEANEGWAGY